MDYFTKIDTPPSQDPIWNLPEQKQGKVNIIGGNSQNFRTEIKISEFVSTNYPVKELHTVLPDALRSKLPNLPNFIFLPSTESGSFADASSLSEAIDSADYNLILGDFSKNSLTIKALASACQDSQSPLLLTRDAIDLVIAESPASLLMRKDLILFTSMPQLIKLFHSVYYPKMLLLSQSLVQVANALHKFTQSYPVRVVTLHSEQILIATNGEIKAISLASSGYLPITFWNGELAAKISILNLYNPNSFIDATLAAIYHK